VQSIAIRPTIDRARETAVRATGLTSPSSPYALAGDRGYTTVRPVIHERLQRRVVYRTARLCGTACVRKGHPSNLAKPLYGPLAGRRSTAAACSQKEQVGVRMLLDAAKISAPVIGSRGYASDPTRLIKFFGIFGAAKDRSLSRMEVGFGRRRFAKESRRYIEEQRATRNLLTTAARSSPADGPTDRGVAQNPGRGWHYPLLPLARWTVPLRVADNRANDEDRTTNDVLVRLLGNSTGIILHAAF
jgi:hypothetical protein